MTCPWPEVEAQRRKWLAKSGRTFTYVQCAGCTRWFGAEHAEGTQAPVLCEWVCNPPKRNTSGLAASRRTRGIACALAFFLLASTRTAGADSDAPESKPGVSTPTDCARVDEPLEARRDRLLTALRLVEMEIVVKRGRKHRGRK